MMLERDIQESIRQAAKDFGWSSRASHPKTLLETFTGDGSGGFFYHTWNSQKSEKGFPDIVMSNGTHLIVAEVKRNRPHGRITPEQRVILDILSAHIPLTFLWREDDLAEAYEVLANPELVTLPLSDRFPVNAVQRGKKISESLWTNRRDQK